jgi:hypothetical protein
MKMSNKKNPLAAKWQKFSKKWGQGGLRRSIARKLLRNLPATGTVTVAVDGRQADRRPAPLSVPELIDQKFPSCMALGTYFGGLHAGRRINVVTDSINAGSLYGGVATALIMAGLACEKYGHPLRVITRVDAANPKNLQSIFKLYGIDDTRFEIELIQAALPAETPTVPMCKQDIFLTTSWWSTASTMRAVPKSSIVYLLQEDERMFYAFNDVRLACESVMREEGIRFVVNSETLYRHLLQDGFDNLARQGTCFDPAFPKTLYRRREDGALTVKKKRFFFYARPNNERNLFYLGIQVIVDFLTKGKMAAEEWEIIFCGKDIPPIQLPFDTEVTILQNLSWDAYCELANTVDLALCLMYTPHSSYPPLDLATSGAVVVTNSFGLKQDFSRYSANILVAPPSVQALSQALVDGMALAEDTVQRRRNCEQARIPDDWRAALSNILPVFE